MTDHGKECRNGAAPGKGCDKRAQDYGDRRLGKVDGEDDGSHFFTVGSHHICHARVAASVVADVVVKKLLRQYDSRVYATDEVAYRNTQQYCYKQKDRFDGLVC